MSIESYKICAHKIVIPRYTEEVLYIFNYYHLYSLQSNNSESQWKQKMRSNIIISQSQDIKTLVLIILKKILKNLYNYLNFVNNLKFKHIDSFCISFYIHLMFVYEWFCLHVYMCMTCMLFKEARRVYWIFWSSWCCEPSGNYARLLHCSTRFSELLGHP